MTIALRSNADNSASILNQTIEAIAISPVGAVSFPKGVASFPPGTRLLFPQAAAPISWTQVSDDTANNRMLRVVSGAGGNSVGGSHDPVLMNVVPAHTHGFSTGNQSADHSHSGNTSGANSDHTHAVNDPGHTHRIDLLMGNIADASAGIHTASVDAWEIGTTRAGIAAAGTGITMGGISANHEHAFGTGGVSVNHTHSGSTDNGSSQLNWVPRYLNLILCVKD